MRSNDSSNEVQLLGIETVIASQTERLKPELASLLLTFNMYVWRLIAVEACEEESIRAGNPFDSWHFKTPLTISSA
jgi:hypothetical protein